MTDISEPGLGLFLSGKKASRTWRDLISLGLEREGTSCIKQDDYYYFSNILPGGLSFYLLIVLEVFS